MSTSYTLTSKAAEWNAFDTYNRLLPDIPDRSASSMSNSFSMPAAFKTFFNSRSCVSLNLGTQNSLFGLAKPYGEYFSTKAINSDIFPSWLKYVKSFGKPFLSFGRMNSIDHLNLLENSGGLFGARKSLLQLSIKPNLKAIEIVDKSNLNIVAHVKTSAHQKVGSAAK